MEFGKIIPQKYKLIWSIKEQIHSQKHITKVLYNWPGGESLWKTLEFVTFSIKISDYSLMLGRPKGEQTKYFSKVLKSEIFKANFQHRER